MKHLHPLAAQVQSYAVPPHRGVAKTLVPALGAFWREYAQERLQRGGIGSLLSTVVYSLARLLRRLLYQIA